MLETIQDANYSIRGILETTLNATNSSGGMLETTQDANYSTGGILGNHSEYQLLYQSDAGINSGC